jgi:glycosyltransferase involved in cell wall biosynthesis
VESEQRQERARETAAETSGLVLDLERPLPPALPAGTSTAVFAIGTCFHRTEAIRDLDLIVDGTRHRPAAWGMPRPDVAPDFRNRPEDPRYRSGFWATLPIERRRPHETVALGVRVRLASGRDVLGPLGEIEVVERPSPGSLQAVPERPGPGLIGICMATFEPDMALFTAQVESLRSQADDRWICLISDDCSSLEHVERIKAVVGDDPRFALSRSEQRLGFYRNFERALKMVPADAELVALCDQDDRWHPDKLAVLRGALGDAVLVYSDQRLVDAEGRVLRETLWKGRRNNHTNIASMLIANTITGAAALFRRELLDLALPFPDTPGFQFHDHWLGVLALAAGDVAYVDRPLYDYVQHPGAVFGDVTHGASGGLRGRLRLASPLRWRRFPERWRAAYFYGYLAREVQAQTLLVRGGERLSAGKRRALRRFISSARSPAAFAWLAARPLRSLARRNETLASEAELAKGILWRWLIGLRLRRGRRPGRVLYDASFPPPGSFEQKRLRRWRARL